MSKGYQLINNNGSITINGAYTLPIADGSPNQVLLTNGAGVVSYGSPVVTGTAETIAYFSSGGTALVGDTQFTRNQATHATKMWATSGGAGTTIDFTITGEQFFFSNGATNFGFEANDTGGGSTRIYSNNISWRFPTSDSTGTQALVSNGAGQLSFVSIPAAGLTTLAAIGSSANANGATISGVTLNLEPASASFGGVVTTGIQTIAGAKTFSTAVTSPAFTSTVAIGTPPFVVTSTTPVTNLSIGGNAATATLATTSTNLAGGSGGTIPYQSAVGTTAMLANGNAGDLLQSNGTTLAPAWIPPAFSSGSYTPTLTNVANLAASTVYDAQWMRIGNVVTVGGRVEIDPTTPATLTQLGISLPIASDIQGLEGCVGTAAASNIAGQVAAIVGDATNNRAQMQWISGDITNQSMYYTYVYTII